MRAVGSISKIIKTSIENTIGDLKRIFFPAKEVRRQFWMILVAMFLAVYSRSLFEKLIVILTKDYQPAYIEAIASILAFIVLIFSFLVLYFTGLALLWIGEILIVRDREGSG